MGMPRRRVIARPAGTMKRRVKQPMKLLPRAAKASGFVMHRRPSTTRRRPTGRR